MQVETHLVPPRPGAVPIEHGQSTLDRIQSNLDRFVLLAAEGRHGGVNEAAVSITLMDHPRAGSCFILTRRASQLRRNAGQWALPGGRLEVGESVVEGALREMKEEIGVSAAVSSVLGRLDRYVTDSMVAITPIVTWIGDPVSLSPSAEEVASVHLVPLSELLRRDSPRYVERREGRLMQLLIGDRRIHAPTAALLFQFAEVALRGRATRVHEEPQPTFTRT